VNFYKEGGDDMTVWNDILSQVDNLNNVIEAHTRADRKILEQAAWLVEKSSQVIFTGVGSGLNATIPAVYYLMSQGHPAQYIDTTELIYNLLPGLKGGVLVLNTRSGETAELIRATEIAGRQGIATIAISNEPSSTVARLADICLPTYSRWDDLVVISAYGGMLASELVLAGQILGELDEVLADLKAAAAEIGNTLQQSIEKRHALRCLFAETRPVYLLGRGPSIASTHGGALVIEEMSRRPVVAMATGLFRQGPIEVVDERFQAILFEGAGEPARLNRILAYELLKKGAGLAWVGSQHLEGAINILLPPFSAHILPLLEIVPCQVLAHDLTCLAGIEPGTVRYIQKVIKDEEGIPSE
jgi:glucosamine--fructose-6-phosphate aminotransferase (isomerizing)